MERTLRRLGATSALLLCAAVTPAAFADGTSWTDGPVVNVVFVRTVDGHFDDYMKWLATAWKKQEEALKKAGIITSYEVMVGEPRNPHDADIYLVTEYKNWAALDGVGGKMDSVSAQLEGSLQAANTAEADRAKIRTVLGSETMQVANLK